MSKILIKAEGITDVHTQAVVNAANENLWEGGGVCGALFCAAGRQALTKACDAIGYCPTGEAVITPAFDLQGSEYIIHAVGPIYQGGKQGEEKLLKSAYFSALGLAKEKNLHSIGFPLISAGIYGYPLREAWQCALTSCRAWIGDNPDYDMEIVFAIPSEENRSIGQQMLEQK